MASEKFRTPVSKRLSIRKPAFKKTVRLFFKIFDLKAGAQNVLHAGFQSFFDLETGFQKHLEGALHPVGCQVADLTLSPWV